MAGAGREYARTPPKDVAKTALKGLKLRGRFRRGGTAVSVARARDLGARRPLSADAIRHMASYFARHRLDRRAPNFGNEDNPTATYIAWLLRGGDAGAAWASRESERLG